MLFTTIMEVVLPNAADRVHQLGAWGKSFHRLNRATLLNLAANPEQHTHNINVKHAAIIQLQNRLETVRKALEKKKTHRDPRTLLKDNEVIQLFNLVRSEQDFPILVDINYLQVDNVVHGSKEELEKARLHKEQVVKDVEENCALLRSTAALLIIDFGSKTNAFQEIRQDLIEELKFILIDMLKENHETFITITDHHTIKNSTYFKSFVEALYFLDRESARPYMDIFKIGTHDFSFQRRNVG